MAAPPWLVVPSRRATTAPPTAGGSPSIAGPLVAQHEGPGVRSHYRSRNRGTQYLSKSGMKWMNGRTERQLRPSPKDTSAAGPGPPTVSRGGSGRHGPRPPGRISTIIARLATAGRSCHSVCHLDHPRYMYIFYGDTLMIHSEERLNGRTAHGYARRDQGFVPLPGMVGYVRCLRLEPPLRPTPQKYGTWYPGGVRPTPPELRNMMPGISGITAGIR
jgi:hypothetical protein